MIQFPNNLPNPDYGMKIQAEDNILRSESENGRIHTRRRFTKARKKFELTWSALTFEQADIFETFFRETCKDGSLEFQWTNPQDNKTYIVMFEEPPEQETTNFNICKITTKWQEV